jgi:hypothetical protein
MAARTTPDPASRRGRPRAEEDRTLRIRRVSIDLTFATIALVMAASGVVAQESAPQPVRVIQVPVEPEAREERLEQIRRELQGAYERLFELEVAWQNANDDPAVLDSLAVERDALRLRAGELSQRLAAEKQLELRSREVKRVPRRSGEADLYVLFEELSQIEGPEDVGRILEGRELSEVLASIGEQLQNMEIDLSSERVRIDTGTGGKISFSVPEELREELNQGMREIGPLINRAFADSSLGARNWAEILEQIPQATADRWSDRRTGRRKVIAESVFSTGNDFEVADDEIVQGDVLLIGADAYVSGEVQGNVYVLFGDLIVEERGLVAKDAISVGGRVLVDNRAEILGRRLDFGDLGDFTGVGASGGIAWAIYAGRLVVLVALLLLVYAMLHERMALMVEHGALQPARNLLSGAIWFTCIFGLFVIASVGLAVSVIGIPVVLVLALAMGVVSMMAYLAGCELVGRRLVALFRPEGQIPAGWQGALIGVALFELPAIAVLLLTSAGVDGMVTRPLTGLEYIVRFLALCVGFGAVVATRLGRRRTAAPTAGVSADDVVSAGA